MAYYRQQAGPDIAARLKRTFSRKPGTVQCGTPWLNWKRHIVTEPKAPAPVNEHAVSRSLLRHRTHLSLRTALAASVCVLINAALHLQVGYLAPLGACLVLILGSGNAFALAAQGYVATLIAGLVSVAITAVFGEAPPLYTFVMLTWLTVWLAHLSRFPIGQMLGGIMIAMILFTAIFDSPPDAGDLYVNFHKQMFIGFMVAGAVDRWVWPEHARDVLFRQLALIFQGLGRQIDSLRTAASLRAESPEPTFNHLLELISRVKKGREVDGQPYLRLAAHCRLLWGRVTFLHSYFREAIDPAREQALAGRIDELVLRCRTLARCALNRAPVENWAPATAAHADSLQEPETEIPDPRGRRSRFAAETRRRVVGLAAADLVSIGEYYNHALLAKAHRRTNSGFLFQSSADSWKLAIKTTLIAALAIVGQSFFDFPGSTVVSFYAVSFGLIPNLGQVHLRGRSGTLGVLFAILYGFVGIWILSYAPHFVVMVALFFLGVFVSSYVAFGAERRAFGGLQSALIMSYIFLFHAGPGESLDLAFTRAAALIVAALIALLVHRLLWPVDPARVFRNGLAERLIRFGKTSESLSAGDSQWRGVIRELTESRLAGAQLVNDAQYVLGNRSSLIPNYLEILSALESLIVEYQTYAIVRERYPDNPLFPRLLAESAPSIDQLSKGFASAGQALLGESDQVARIRIPDFPSTPSESEEGRVSDEVMREVDVLRSTLVGMANSLCRIQQAIDALHTDVKSEIGEPGIATVL